MLKSSQYFKKIIQKLKVDYPFITRAQILGHAAGIDICEPNTQKPATQKVHTLIEMALNSPCEYDNQKYGLILTAGGLHNASLMLSPSVFISEEELNLFNKLFRFYISKVFEL